MKKSSAMSKKISDMKSFFESKGSVMKPSNNPLSNPLGSTRPKETAEKKAEKKNDTVAVHMCSCLLYTSPSPRDQRGSRMPSSA